MRPQDLSKKGAGSHRTMDLSNGAHRQHHKKVLKLNIYSNKAVENTKDDDNYERRVQLKDLIFYMQRDPQMRKSQILY